MQKSFYELIALVRNNSVDDLQEILFMFKPLIKKLSRVLHYEEGETDLIIFFIELIKNIKLSSFAEKSDAIIVKYIHKSLLNKTFELSRRYSKMKFNFVEFDENVLNMKNNYQSKSVFEEDICFFEYILKELSGIQRKVILYKYLKGYSDREISVKLKISRQAVNKAKNRAFKKIKKDYENYFNL
ncbi:glycosylating toxin sigma factor TcdR [Clostridioides difficile]|uniref:Glycosylating toxin sigma factor TcdR n=9 Tax=Clostridioides difficile TaxID=1496 RepID=A0A9P4DAL9_CLODI|nr:glycosylating toxin sigma factor TcdR [Clostridioides difficile]AWH76413.1 sigma-70 family RNA polymerase sigma factor [Clostridioides difficile]AWH80189.1 sigma-70 family RNA polymerase sigma factor [Clostridioides difficile]AXU45281.1 transcriptional regulator [Clostridioides difficile]EGT2216646.1 glycosylating toxin sigma factor TcdR [Clostridioides difficile]EGT3891319.1 sigma-70 family RNA polymerase sigma factor [Clostridioides difficile]